MNLLIREKKKLKYFPIGTRHCEGKCDRKVINTKEGSILVCDGCNRIVIDNRKENENIQRITQ